MEIDSFLRLFLNSVGKQNMPPKNMPLWYKDYSEKADREALKTNQKLTFCTGNEANEGDHVSKGVSLCTWERRMTLRSVEAQLWIRH